MRSVDGLQMIGTLPNTVKERNIFYESSANLLPINVSCRVLMESDLPFLILIPLKEELLSLITALEECFRAGEQIISALPSGAYQGFRVELDHILKASCRRHRSVSSLCEYLGNFAVRAHTYK